MCYAFFFCEGGVFCKIFRDLYVIHLVVVRSFSGKGYRSISWVMVHSNWIIPAPYLGNDSNADQNVGISVE